MQHDRELRERLRRLEQRIMQAHSGGTAGPHTHSGYAASSHAHNGYADAAHAHAGYATADDLAAHAAQADPHPGYLTQTEGDGRYSLANHAHAGGSSAVSVQKVTADQATTVVALANVTNMGFAAAATTAYEFEYLLAITSAAATTGWQFGFTGPLTPAMFVAVCEYQSSATAWTSSTLNAVTYGAFTLVTAAYAANTPIVVRIKGVVVTGAVAGTVQLQFRSEVAGSAVTVKRGSTLKVA